MLWFILIASLHRGLLFFTPCWILFSVAVALSSQVLTVVKKSFWTLDAFMMYCVGLKISFKSPTAPIIDLQCCTAPFNSELDAGWQQDDMTEKNIQSSIKNVLSLAHLKLTKNNSHLKHKKNGTAYY